MEEVGVEHFHQGEVDLNMHGSFSFIDFDDEDKLTLMNQPDVDPIFSSTIIESQLCNDEENLEIIAESFINNNKNDFDCVMEKRSYDYGGRSKSNSNSSSNYDDADGSSKCFDRDEKIFNKVSSCMLSEKQSQHFSFDRPTSNIDEVEVQSYLSNPAIVKNRFTVGGSELNVHNLDRPTRKRNLLNNNVKTTVSSVQEENITSRSSRSKPNKNIEQTGLHRFNRENLESNFQAKSTIMSETQSFSTCSSDRRKYSLGDSNSKNAIAARENRQKKKMYTSNLEDQVSTLQKENESLNSECIESKRIVAKLQREVQYYRSIIENQSTLSSVLQNVLKTPGVKISSSFLSFDKGRSEAFSKRQLQSDIQKVKNKNNNACKKRKISKSPFSDMDSDKLDTFSGDKSHSSNESSLKSGFFWTEEESFIDDNSIEFSSNNFRCGGVEVTQDSTSDEELANTKALFDHPKTRNQDGICLHVSGKNVSLEFCTHCSSQANSNIYSDHSYA